MNFNTKLLKWFKQYGRHDLPWQKKITLYRIWISEIMLQQTQVTTVIPYYHRFIKHFPTISKLANASLDEVLSLWAGLGYYARAKNLYNAANIIKSKHKGKFPTQFEDILALPGIGRSTAGALLSIGLKKPYPILDGNVKRVLSRHFAIPGWPNDPKTAEKLWAISEQLTPAKDPNHYTQAIMDLGATVCTRSKPNCSLCPVEKTCQAKKNNTIAHYPGKRIKTEKPIRSTIVVILMDLKNEKVFLEKRPIKGIWGGLWSFPECPLNINIQQWCKKHLNHSVYPLQIFAPFRHTFSHFHLDIHPHIHQLRTQKRLSNQWHSWKVIPTLALPAPTKRLLATLEDCYRKVS